MTRKCFPIRLTIALCLWCLLLSTQSSFAQDGDADVSVYELLPEGELVVDVMELLPTRRTAELTKKLQEAIGQDPEWWIEHVKKAKPGQSIDYDERTGLTKEEFE